MTEDVQRAQALSDWQARLGSPPRDAVAGGLNRYWHQANRRWRRVVVGATIACMLAFVIVFPWPLLSTIQLDLSGQQADGVVTSTRFEYRGLGGHIFMRKRPVYGTKFRYRDLAGDLHTGFSLDTREFTPGDRVIIEYLPGERNKARVRDGFFVSGGYWAGIWTCLFPGLSLFGIWNYRRSVQRHRELVRNGRLAIAQIEQLWVDGSPDKGNGWIALRLDAQGQRIQMTHSLQGADLARARALTRRGAAVAVLHHQDEPRECIVLDLLPAAWRQDPVA